MCTEYSPHNLNLNLRLLQPFIKVVLTLSQRYDKVVTI